MATTNLIAFKDEAAPDGPRAPVEPAVSNSDKWTGVGPAPLRRGRRLDVDEVLERSLPRADAATGRKFLVN